MIASNTQNSIRLEYTPFHWYQKAKFVECLMCHECTFTKTKIPILNEPISFDIETTSFRRDDEKYATMYVWAFDIFDTTFLGRTWSDFAEMLTLLEKFYRLRETKRQVVIYIHNLSYEFQWMMKYFEWSKVFAVDSRTVLFALTKLNIEFRCSYLLYGSSLDEMGKELQKISNRMEKSILEKLPDYNYELPRHFKTTLTKDEIEYVVHDVKIVAEYIRIQIKEECGIDNIPRTRTGYVRRLCKYLCLYDKKNGRNYREFIQSLTLTLDEYNKAKNAFAGGYTHCAIRYMGIMQKDVTSFDFSSSYPAVMLSNKFPMKKGEKYENLKKDVFEKYMHEDLCTVTITLKDVKPKFLHDFYISKSKCEVAVNAITSNGRVYSADKIRVTITSIDYRIIEKVYKFEIDEIGVLYKYQSWYLPKPIIQAILDLYGKKTSLKDRDGYDMEYMLSKGMLNSIYGMCVTDILRDVFGYDFKNNEWKEVEHVFAMEREKQEELMNKANANGGRFLFYLWGVFVTAYARYNLWTGIIECKEDYIYSDTDSLKIKNAEKHMEYIERYNNEIKQKIETVLNYYKLDVSLMHPKTIDGKEKQIGIWAFDGYYKYFKSLGAKRYIYIQTNKKGIDELHITIGGVNKTTGCKYFVTLTNHPDKNDFTNDSEKDIKKLFDSFSKKTVIPKEYSGKLIHTYGDAEFTMEYTDYNGEKAEIHEMSFVHLELTKYKMKAGYAEEFRQFIRYMKRYA